MAATLRDPRVSSILITATVLCIATLPLGADALRPPEDEYRVKAAILYNLAKFVEWPADVLPTPATPLTVCVLGSDPFGAVLDDEFKGRQVGGHSIAVHRGADIDKSCHIVFVSSSERKRTAAVLERIGAKPVLTVGDDEGFSSAGGIIELVTEGERIRFAINAGAAERAHLHLSARLLALATPNRGSPAVPR